MNKEEKIVKYVFGMMFAYIITKYYFDRLILNYWWLILFPIWLLLLWVIFKRIVKGDEKIW